MATVKRWAVFTHGLTFVLGFSFIFVFVIGITAGLIGQIGNGVIRANEWIMRIGGLLVIVLGLHTLGVIRIPFLYYDTRSQQAPRQELGYLGSFLMGITFAAGWSPCVGPILGSILTLGASTGSIGQAVFLLSIYALCLGLPFLLTALLIERATVGIRLCSTTFSRKPLPSSAIVPCCWGNRPVSRLARLAAQMGVAM